MPALFSDPAWKWADPSTWPWMIWVWAAFFLLGNAGATWRWYRKHSAQSWPTTFGRVDMATVNRPSEFWKGTSKGRGVAGEIVYLYSAEGQSWTGRHKQAFLTDEEADEFTRDLKGRVVTVHYNPRRPSDSMLLADSVEALLSSRTPSPEQRSRKRIPEWARPLLWPLAALSLTGLVISMWVHGNGILGKSVVGDFCFFLLHLGCIALFGLGIFATGRANTSDLKELLKDVPDGLRWLVYGFFAYAMVNFWVYWFQVAPAGDRHALQPSDSRGFSGHWMLFYAVSFAMFYTAATGESASPSPDSTQK
jgi:hypothetical protein